MKSFISMLFICIAINLVMTNCSGDVAVDLRPDIDECLCKGPCFVLPIDTYYVEVEVPVYIWDTVTIIIGFEDSVLCQNHNWNGNGYGHENHEHCGDSL